MLQVERWITGGAGFGVFIEVSDTEVFGFENFRFSESISVLRALVSCTSAQGIGIVCQCSGHWYRGCLYCTGM